MHAAKGEESARIMERMDWQKLRAELDEMERGPSLGRSVSRRIGTRLVQTVDPESGWEGRVLQDKYILTRQVGRGATSWVFAAKLIDGDREDFAVKLIDLQRLRPGAVKKAYRQVQEELWIMDEVRSTHTVRFVEMLKLRGEIIALVTEFIDGIALEELMDDGPVPLPRALELVHQMAIGLQEVHLRNVVHGDIKPANVLLTKDDTGRDFIKLIDFGVSKLQTSKTIQQGFMGTPLYASPERFQDGPLHSSSDLYSLGVMFFAMLTGRPPFRGNSIVQLAQQHTREAPPTLGDVSPNIPWPDALEELMGQLLAKTIEDRPPSAAAVARRLMVILRELKQKRRTPRPSTSTAPAGVMRKKRPKSGIVLRHNTPAMPSLEEASSGVFKRITPAKPVTAINRAKTPTKPVRRELLMRLRGEHLLVHGRGRILRTHRSSPSDLSVLARTSAAVTDLDFDRDYVVVSTESGEVRGGIVGKVARPLEVLWREAVGIDHIVMLPNAQRIALATRRTLRIRARRDDWAQVSTLSFDSPITTMATSPGTSSIAAALEDGTVVHLTLDDHDTLTAVAHLELPARARSVAVSADGYISAVLLANGDLLVSEFASGRMVGRAPARIQQNVPTISFDPRGKLIGAQPDDTALQLVTLW